MILRHGFVPLGFCTTCILTYSPCWWQILLTVSSCDFNGPLARYVELWVDAPGMPGTFSPPPRVSDPDMHHGTCVTHVPWCMPGSLTSGFLWSRWRGKRSRHSRRMRNPQFYISGKRPMLDALIVCLSILHHNMNYEMNVHQCLDLPGQGFFMLPVDTWWSMQA